MRRHERRRAETSGLPPDEVPGEMAAFVAGQVEAVVGVQRRVSGNPVVSADDTWRAAPQTGRWPGCALSARGRRATRDREMQAARGKQVRLALCYGRDRGVARCRSALPLRR